MATSIIEKSLASDVYSLTSNVGRVRMMTDTDTFTVDLTKFGQYASNRFQGYLILTRYGVFYLRHYVGDGTQTAQCFLMYPSDGITCTPTMSSDGNSVTLVFSRVIYGGITVFG